MFLSFRSFRQAQSLATPNTFSHLIKGCWRSCNNSLTLKNSYASCSTPVHRRAEERAVQVLEHHAQTAPKTIQGHSSLIPTDQELVRLLNGQLSGRKLGVDGEGEALDYRKAGFDRREPDKRNRSEDGEVQDVVDAYVLLRKRGTYLLRRPHPLALVHIAWKARQENLQAIVNSVVDDVLFLHESNLAAKSNFDHDIREPHSWDYALAIAHLLDLVSDYGRGRHERGLSLAKAFLLSKKGGLDTLPNLSIRALIGFSRAIVVQRSDWTSGNIPLLEAFVEYLDYATIPSAVEARLSQDQQLHEKGTTEDSLIWALFRLTADLARRGCDKIAYLLFRFLVTKEYVHPAAIQKADQAKNDFRMTILSALVRSSIEYGWLDGASRLLQTADLSNPNSKDQLSRLLYRVVYTAVQSRTRENIELSSKLIVTFFTENNGIRLSDGLVRQFYMIASSVNAGEAATKVYSVLRSAPVRARHIFPAPDGPALDWILNYIYTTGNMEVGKLLAQHLVESPDTLSIYLRGSVIARCAAMGHAEETKLLWERYSQGQDSNMVVAHSRAMINVVSLFHKRSTLAESRTRSPMEYSLGQLRSATADVMLKNLKTTDMSNQQNDSSDMNDHPSQKPPSRNPVANLHVDDVQIGPSQRRHMASLRSDLLVDGANASIASRDLEAQATEAEKPPHGDSNTSLISSRSDALDMSRDDYSKSAEDTCAPSADLSSPSAPVAEQTVSSATDSSEVEEDANLAFAHHVLDSFRWAKEPLNAASHHDLTTLARAAAILGDIEMCTRTLRLIIDRREVPDLYDLNVIVASMARWKPRQAMFMVIKMIKSGIKPNGFTFASVLHGALAINDMVVAGKIFHHAREIGPSQLMPEMCTTLIHASLNAAASAYTYPATQDREDNPQPQPQTTEEPERKIEYLRQVYDLLTSDACPPSVRSVRLGRSCVEDAMRLDDPTLAFEFWKLMLKAKADEFSKRLAEQERMMRQRVADKIRKHCQRGLLETERGREMVAELGAHW